MRYFLEVSYKGTNYAGFQAQQNANTIQAEVERALNTFLHNHASSAPVLPSSEYDDGQRVRLTGSSRTDTGVHALQNFFHFDVDSEISSLAVYNLNSLLPNDIAIRSLTKVEDEAHCRFNAISREYRYSIITKKDPFRNEIAWFYPYRLDVDKLQQAAAFLLKQRDFTSFAKRKSQVKTNDCTIIQSEWMAEKHCLVYHVKANRFLRGMVKGLVGTMLLVGRNKISLAEFENIILAKDCTKANFAAPAKGLFLIGVKFNNQ